MEFNNRTALVTGASRGIGASIAHELMAQGAEVVVTARSMDSLEANMTKWTSLGLKAHAVVCDLSSQDAGEQLAAAADAAVGTSIYL